MPTIALVDDDRNILTSVSIALEAEGYRIMTYTDGASALDGFKSSPPDLAILDIKMPRMDGMETLRRLRQKSDIPVIFLTSKDEEIDELFDQQALRERFADEIVRAHFEAEQFVDLLILGGEEDHRHVGLLAHAAQKLHAVHARHLDVEDGEIGRLRLETIERGRAVGVGKNAIAFCLERHRDRSENIAVVVDQSDRWHTVSLPPAGRVTPLGMEPMGGAEM